MQKMRIDRSKGGKKDKEVHLITMDIEIHDRIPEVSSVPPVHSMHELNKDLQISSSSP